MSTPGTFLEFFSTVSPIELTPAQRVWAAVAIDRVQPPTLDEPDRALCRTIFGTDGPIPERAFDIVALFKGARVGGTYLSALGCLWRALTVPLRLAPGEAAFTPLVAPDTRLARQSLNYIRGALQVAGWETLGSAIESLTIRRADGVENTFHVLPAARAGAATRGRTYTASHIQEACFLRGGDAQVNDREVMRSISARVVRGGATFVESTPWTQSGVLWDLTEANHGHPTEAVAAKAPTMLFRAGDDKIAHQIEAERKRDPENAAREFDAIPLGGGADEFFDGPTLQMAQQLAELDRAHPRAKVYWAADFGFRKDASALAGVVEVEGQVDLVSWLEFRPAPGKPLVPSEVVHAFSAEMRRRGFTGRVMADMHSSESIREEFGRHGVSLAHPPGNAKEEIHLTVRDALRESRVRIAPTAGSLVAQLQAIVAKPTGGGRLAISAPRSPRGGHGDLASAFILAVYQSLRAKPRSFSAYLEGDGTYQSGRHRSTSGVADFMKRGRGL